MKVGKTDLKAEVRLLKGLKGKDLDSEYEMLISGCVETTILCSDNREAEITLNCGGI